MKKARERTDEMIVAKVKKLKKRGWHNYRNVINEPSNMKIILSVVVMVIAKLFLYGNIRYSLTEQPVLISVKIEKNISIYSLCRPKDPSSSFMTIINHFLCSSESP